jgi:hypothetical protein
MTVGATAGPIIAFGNEATPPGMTPRGAQLNPDAGPSMFYAGTSILDPRAAYTYFPGQSPDSPTVLGWMSPDILALDWAPAASATANVAALQVTTLNVPLTLASVTAGDITVGSVFRNAVTGANVTALRIGPLPAGLSAGASSYADIWNPATVTSRVVTITAGATASSGTVLVSGYDIYGYPQTEQITAPGANATVVGKKTWKWISSVTPSASTLAPGISVGTGDIFGFPVKVDSYPYVTVFWNGALAATGVITPADATTPTALTGDVRGTFGTASPVSNGTIRLIARITLPIASVATTTNAALITGMFGVTPA